MMRLIISVLLLAVYADASCFTLNPDCSACNITDFYANVNQKTIAAEALLEHFKNIPGFKDYSVSSTGSSKLENNYNATTNTCELVFTCSYSRLDYFGFAIFDEENELIHESHNQGGNYNISYEAKIFNWAKEFNLACSTDLGYHYRGQKILFGTCFGLLNIPAYDEKPPLE